MLKGLSIYGIEILQTIYEDSYVYTNEDKLISLIFYGGTFTFYLTVARGCKVKIFLLLFIFVDNVNSLHILTCHVLYLNILVGMDIF